MQQISEWWLGLTRQRQLMVGGGLALLVGIGLLGWWLSRPAPAALPATVPVTQTSASHVASSRPAVGASGASQVSSHDTHVFVDVQGAVAHPGLYQFTPEMRVADAIKAAGGLTAKADRQQVNLASRLTDQQQLTIPQKGEHATSAAASATAPSTAKPAGAGSTSAKDGATAVVNLNTATVSDLTQLTGIGEKKAQKIVDYRTAHGSFQTVKDLAPVPGFGEKTVANLQDQLTT